ncbi:MAG: hypothetical protein KGZ39_07775 [Simkania sp.]|nr:hypothetical protein [Simkania sp.]
MSNFPAELIPVLGSPHFLEQATEYVARFGKKDELYRLLQIDEERAFCLDMERSGLQDPALARYRRRAYLLAMALIDENGGIAEEAIKKMLELWTVGGRIFYPLPASDEAAFLQVQNVLTWLCHSNSAIKKILKFSLPVANSYLESLIKVSLFLPPSHVLRHVDVRRAVLSACFSLLRQGVGSCFATAPAILIHSEQIEYFLADMEELLSTARLKRIVEGNEYVVPCSPSWGIGDLKKNLISSLHTKEIAKSPGLIAALGAMHKGQEGVLELLSQVAKGKKTLSVEECFEDVLLQEHHITKERWELFKQGNRFIPRSLIVMQRDPQEAACEKIETFFGWAKDTFRSVVDHPLLKSWEYTLASFSEVKMEFSRWNLYASLGFDSKEAGGLGSVLVGSIDQTLNRANQKIEGLQRSYEIAVDQARAAEALLTRASSEREARRLAAEYQSRVHHMRSLRDMRDEEHQQGEHFVALYAFLFKQYDKCFPVYFQEIYDAEMFDASLGSDQDSAAGFRLVYKHGRNDPSQWTLIRNSRGYIDALLDFFKISEPEIIAACAEEVVAKEIPRLTNLLIAHLQNEEFITTALLRMKKAHSAEKQPQQAPEMLLGEKTPWAYISGGTMETLLKTYYRAQSPIHSEGRWVEGANDLLILLLETLKGFSFSNAEIYRKNKSKRALMHSPTHAFLLLPGSPQFCEGWEHDTFTYTWVRDQLIEPSKEFYKTIVFNRREVQFLIDRLSRELSEEVLRFLKNAANGFSDRITLEQFVAAAGPELTEHLDGWLFCHMPLYDARDWEKHVFSLVEEREEHEQLNIQGTLTSEDILKMAKGFFLVSHFSLQQRIDLHEAILESAIQKKMVAPRMVFADTNWPHCLFAFAWGAASKRLRLFRIERAGGVTRPMTHWEQYLNGSMRLAWSVYNKPEQYS